MRILTPFLTLSLSTATHFELVLTNDIPALLARRDMTQKTTLFLNEMSRRGWSLAPTFSLLASSEDVRKANLTAEIPIEEPLSPERLQIMRKNHMHVHYSLVTTENVSLEEVREVTMGDQTIDFKGIVKHVGRALETERKPPPPPSFTSHPTDGTPYIVAENHFLRSSQDYSDCKKYPCQGYLYLNDTPSPYKAPGNNIVKTWEKLGVKGEDSRILILEPGTWSDKNGQLKQKHIKSGNELTPSEHKTNVAGIILADHSGHGVRGIAPNMKGGVDIGLDILNIDSSMGELVKLVTYGDVMTVSMGLGESHYLALGEIAQYHDECVEFDICEFPSFFMPKVNAVYNSLIELGVSIFASTGNSGTTLDADYWKKTYPPSVRGPQKVASVTSWDPETNKLRSTGARVQKAKKSLDHVAIQFANWGSSVVTTSLLDSSYVTDFKGSSAATPITAGVALLVQSAAKKYLGKFISPEEVYDIMYKTGRKLSNSTNVDMSLTRLPDAYEAVKAVQKKAGSSSSSNQKPASTTKKTTTKKKK